MIAAFKFDDEVAARRGARQAHRAHRRLCSGTHESYLFARRKSASEAHGEFDFKFSGHAVTGAPARLRGDGFDDLRMRVTQNQRPPGTHIVDIFISVGVPQARACRAIDDDGISAHGPKRAHGAIDSPDENLRPPAEDFFRARAFLLDKFQCTHWYIWSSISESTGFHPAGDIFGMIGKHDARAG